MRRLPYLLLVTCAFGDPGCGSSQRVSNPEPGAAGAPAPASSPAPAVAVVAAASGPAEVRETLPASSDRKRLTNGLASLRAVCEVTLLALKESNQETLEALRVTEDEYKKYLFPEFSKGGAPSTVPVDFHWFHLNLKSEKGIRNALDSYGGADLELLEPVVTKGVEDYATYRLHNYVEMKVRNRATGKEGQIRVFASVVEMDGEFKILAYPS